MQFDDALAQGDFAVSAVQIGRAHV
jgi:hypothetical protein